MSRPVPFVHPITIRYLEVDRQGVVFNMWYLAYLDDAMTAFSGRGWPARTGTCWRRASTSRSSTPRWTGAGPSVWVIRPRLGWSWRRSGEPRSR